MVERLRPPEASQLFAEASPERALNGLAQALLQATLSPPALALFRVIVAEATRFPELASVLDQEGARREAVDRIAQLLERLAAADGRKLDDPRFAAEQFMQIVVSLPQRRALGLGVPMAKPELDDWARASVRLFLQGCWTG